MSAEMLAEPPLQPMGLGFPLLESAACQMDFFFPDSEILNQEGLCVSLKGRQSCSLPRYLINTLQTESGLVWPFLHGDASASWCGGSCCRLCNLCVRAHSCK